MNKRTAAMIFLVVCLVLALLLLSGAISPLLGGGVFALALVVLGVFSRGFTNKQ